MVDYRDRISVALWVVLLGFEATLLVKLPSTTLVWIAFGSPLSVQLSTNTVLGAILILLAASSADVVVRAHPLARARQLRNSWVYWALPCAVVAVAALLLPAAPTRLNWLVGLGAATLTLGAALGATYHVVDPGGVGYRPARVFLTLLTYAAALLLFLGIYQQRARSLLSSTLVASIGSLLALELLRGTERPLRAVSLHALIAGLVLGEATWALNYWRVPALTGGLLLLLGFYLLVGVSHQGLVRRLDRRVLVEFAVVALISLALMWLLSP
jgi:hypothetical protein